MVLRVVGLLWVMLVRGRLLVVGILLAWCGCDCAFGFRSLDLCVLILWFGVFACDLMVAACGCLCGIILIVLL